MLSKDRRSRGLVRLLAALLALVMVAAACGDSDDDGADDTTPEETTTTTAGETPTTGDSTTTTTEGPTGSQMPDDFDPEGVVRIGSTATVDNEAHFDPLLSPFNGDRFRMELVYGFLLTENEAGGYDPMMVESYEVVDSSTITMKLREGVTFTDGAAYDAEAVKTSLLRTRYDVTDERVLAGQHAGFKFLDDVTVDGPLDITITLNEPAAGEFLQSLASREGSVVSPKQLAEDPDSIDTAPIGAGPYILEEFNEQVLERYRRNPDYHSPETNQVFGYDYIFSPVGPAGVQALQAGDIDQVAITAENVDVLEADDRFTVASNITDFGYMSLNFCRSKPPFDNLMVRQAVQRGLNRDQMNQLVYGGLATPAFGFWPDNHVRYNTAVEDYNYEDLDEAKQLLADSGVTDLDIDLFIVPSNEWIRLAEVVQSQLNEIGFNVTIQQPANIIADFIQVQLPGILMVPGSRTNVDKYGRVFAEGAQQALCGQFSQEVMDLVIPTAALSVDDPDSIAGYQAAEELIAENAWFIPLVYRPTLTAYNSENLGGTPKFSGSRGLTIRDNTTLYPRLQ